ncbi:MAG: phosphatase PAP2 family protein [Bdellovibrionales bacterium]
MNKLYLLIFFLCILLVGLVVWPEADIAVSSLFVRDGFILRENLFLNKLVRFVFYASRFVAVLSFLGAVGFFLSHKNGKARPCMFIFLCLLIAPGLIINLGFKDHWGRARPRDIVAFGGDKEFTPAFFITNQCVRNCSFSSGDAAFGFFLTCFAYVAPLRRRRVVLAGSLVVAGILSGARLLLGAHFLSDILTSALLVMGFNAGLYALFYGRAALADFWKDIMRPAALR